MRAAVIRDYGPPSVLNVVSDWPRPTRKPGEVLVKIHAAAINPVDYKTRKGQFPLPSLIGTLPKVLGADLAGTVLEADAASAFKPGDKVYACSDGARMNNPHGSYAEEMAVAEGLLAPVPASLSFEQAASLPLAGLTAWQALDAAALQPGQRVLIHAGAGGVGSLAIQLAKARGLHVATTCSTRNLAFVKELGADEAVNYTEQRFEEVYKDQPFDAVIDTMGGDYETRSLGVVKPGGAFVSILNSGWLKYYGQGGAIARTLWGLAKGKLLNTLGLGPRYHVVLLRAEGATLAKLGRLVEEGKVKPIIDRVLPLEQIREAHEYLEEGHARGKLVLAVAK